MQNTDVIILGNGLIANTLALALEKLGVQSVRIARRFPEYAKDPRSYAIAQSSLRLFQALGLDFPNATQVNRVELSFGDRFDGKNFALDKGDLLFSMIDHSELAASIDAQLTGKLIEGEPRQFERSEFLLELPEFKLSAPLLIVAEGKYGESLTRLGFGFAVHDYEQFAITAKFKTEIPHEGTARQLFEPTGPLGLLPFDKNGLSIVWSQDADTSRATMALDDSEFVAFLGSKIGSKYGKLEHIHPRSIFPLFGATAHRLTQPRIALVGDSAHAIHPIAGQGLNLGLRDVACVVEAIHQANRIGLDIGSEAVLNQYKNWRKGDIARLETLTRGMNDLTQSPSALTQASLALTQTALGAKSIQNWLAGMSDAPLSPQPPLLEGRLH